MNPGETAGSHRTILEPIRHFTAQRQRHVVLRNLIVLGHVRIEVILAIELRKRGDLRAERQTRAQHVLDCPGIWDRQRARHAQADRTDLGIRLAAELVTAAAEHLRRGLQFDVTLDADHGFILPVHARASSVTCGGCCTAYIVARSYAWAAPSKRDSANSGAHSCKPSGIGWLPPAGVTHPHGTESAGNPASDIGIV